MFSKQNSLKDQQNNMQTVRFTLNTDMTNVETRVETGKSLLAKGEYQQAFDEFQCAWTMSIGYPNHDSVSLVYADALIAHAKALWEENNHVNALVVYQQAFTIFSSYENNKLLLDFIHLYAKQVTAEWLSDPDLKKAANPKRFLLEKIKTLLPVVQTFILQQITMDKHSSLGEIFWTPRGSRQPSLARKTLGEANSLLMALTKQSEQVKWINFEKALQENPANINLYIYRSEKLNQQRRLHLALNDLTCVLLLDPGRSVAYYKRGECYQYSNQTEKALSDMMKVTELEPDCLIAYQQQVKLLNILDRHEEAANVESIIQRLKNKEETIEKFDLQSNLDTKNQRSFFSSVLTSIFGKSYVSGVDASDANKNIHQRPGLRNSNDSL